MTEEIVTGLCRFSYLKVISQNATSRVTAEGADSRSAARKLGARYVMDGSLRRAGNKLRIAVHLVDATSSADLWAEIYERELHPESEFEIVDDLAPRIVCTVADAHGVLAHSMAETLRSKDPSNLTPYEAVLRSFAYFQRLDAGEHLAARSALELAVRQPPDSGDCWALLSLLYSEEYAHGFNLQPDPVGRALTAARRAVDAAPSNHRTHRALASGLVFPARHGCIRIAAERSVALNPLDASGEAQMGFLIAYAGDWERGCALAETARRLNPHYPDWYWFPDLFNAYRKRDYTGALAIAAKINMPGFWRTNMALAAAFGQIGQLEAGEKAVQELLAIKPDFAAGARAELRKWWDSELTEHLIDGLRKSGLEIPSDPNAAKTVRSRPAQSRPLVSSRVDATSPAPAARKIPLWVRPIAAVVLLAAAYLLRPTLPPPQATATTQLTQDGAPKLTAGLEAMPPALATDGSRIYYLQATGAHGVLMQVSANGGETVPVATPVPFDNFFGIAPHGEMVMGGPPEANYTDGLWLMTMPAGQAHRVGDFVAHDASWNNDQTTLYYSNALDLFAANPDSTQPRKLLTANGVPFWMRLSPDGHLLRFSVSDKTNFNSTLWEVRPDGSHLRQLLASWSYSANVCCGSWTPDGKYFVFQSRHDGVASLWAIREAGDPSHKVSHEPVLLTQGEMSEEAPLPSLDGKKVFFIGAVPRGELTRYDPKTHAFSQYLSGISAEGVSFSKDGQRIAYVSYPGGTVWQSRIDGSDRHQLTFSPMQAGLTHWSPDGSEIAFGAGLPGQHPHVYVVPVEGGDPRQLTSGDCDENDPSWSPNGRFIAFTCGGTTLLQQAIDGVLRTVDVKTRQVTDVPDSVGLFSPRWSPDGRYLMAGTTTVDKVRLYDFTTRKWQDLFSGRWDYPTWSRDGKCVYYANHWDPKVPVNRICLADRRMEHIVDLITGGDLVYAHSGWWTGLAPDDSILELRDTSVQEIYALDVKFP